MGKRLLSVMLALLMVVSLLPMSAMANGEDGITVEKDYILIGATREENGTLSPKTNSNVTYAITRTSDETYTLTFYGNGEIPDYYTENQGYTNDGTEIYKVNGTWQNENGVSDGFSEGPVNTNGTYRWCISNRAYYRSTQWDVFNTKHKDTITKVVFEDGITGIGQFTLFNMTGVTEIEIQNPDCDISASAIYYNNATAPNCTVTMDSTVTWRSNSIGYHDNVNESNRGTVTYAYSDAAAFVEKYDDLLDIEGVEDNKTKILDAYEEYMAGNEVFRNAVDSASVTVGETTTTFGEAFAAVYKEVTGTDPSNIVLQGNVQNSETIKYIITKNEDGKYTLRFYAEGGDGKMPDFAIKDTNPDERDDIDRYQNAPWYASQYRNNITHVIYDKSITRTSYLSAAHMYNCTQFDFLNDDVEIVNATIHYNSKIEAKSVLFRYSANADVSSGYVYFNAGNGAASGITSVSYFEAEKFEEAYGSILTSESVTEEQAEEMKAAYEALPTVCKVQLQNDLLDGTTTYAAKLEEILDDFNLGELDDSEVVNSGVIPSEDGESETIHYEITTTDNETYTLRFYDDGGDGVMPGYKVTNEGTDERASWVAYENLPWVNKKLKVIKVIFDDSITSVGSLVLANMGYCAEYELLNPELTSASNAIYVNNEDQINNEGVTIRAYSTADIN